MLACLPALLFAACGQSASAEGVDPRLAEVESWAFAIGSDDVSAEIESGALDPFDLVVIDGQYSHTRDVRKLREKGKLVLAYLAVGTIERDRFWYQQAKPYRLDYWDDWGEWYAKVKAAGFRDLIQNKVAPKILAKGFDGLFLDTVDMAETHPGQAQGMEKLVGALSDQVHGRGGFLFSQNGAAITDPLLPYLDGWNREDVTWTYDFDRNRYKKRSAAGTARAQEELSRIHGRGLLVTATDYVKKGDMAAQNESMANACGTDALPYVSGISLKRIPPQGLICP